MGHRYNFVFLFSTRETEEGAVWIDPAIHGSTPAISRMTNLVRETSNPEFQLLPPSSLFLFYLPALLW